MTINFLYNWPPSERFVRVTFGMSSIEDNNFLFRVGVVKKEDQKKVYWQGISEWLSHEQIKNVAFQAERGDKIVVDKQNKETKETHFKHLWNITESWPSEATGHSTTIVPYDF